MYKPKLSEEAGEYLVREYVEMRKLGASRGQVIYCRSSIVRGGLPSIDCRVAGSLPNAR